MVFNLQYDRKSDSRIAPCPAGGKIKTVSARSSANAKKCRPVKYISANHGSGENGPKTTPVPICLNQNDFRFCSKECAEEFGFTNLSGYITASGCLAQSKEQRVECFATADERARDKYFGLGSISRVYKIKWCVSIDSLIAWRRAGLPVVSTVIIAHNTSHAHFCHEFRTMVQRVKLAAGLSLATTTHGRRTPSGTHGASEMRSRQP